MHATSALESPRGVQTYSEISRSDPEKPARQGLRCQDFSLQYVGSTWELSCWEGKFGGV